MLLFAVHVAVNVPPFNGIVVGNAGVHPANSYHVLLGFAGALIPDPYLAVMLDP